MTTGPQTDLLWYAIHTHPKQEDRASGNLQAWGVETLNPKIKVKTYSQFSTAAHYICKPLFPRYIFARFDISESIHKIKFTRGVQSIVSFAGGPSLIDDSIIACIKSRVAADGYVKMSDDLMPGDPVVICGGVLKDLKGVFERRTKGSDRVMILLTTLEYQGSLSIESDLVKKLA